VTATLSESSTDFTETDLTPTNAAVSNFAGSGTSYSFTLTPSASGAFSVAVAGGTFTDSAGNANTASNTLSRTADLVRPSVTLSSSAPNPTTTSPIPVTVSFSEAVTQFTSSDITVNGATVSGFSGSGANYSFNLVPTRDGVITAEVQSDVCLDAAGNTNTASAQLARTYNIPPIIADIANVSVSDGYKYKVTPRLLQGTGPITWSIVSPGTPPTDMTINPSTGEFTWTPSMAFSPVNVVIQATGPGGNSNENWKITVRPTVWVDFAFTGVEIGSLPQPFNTLGEAVSAAVPGDEVRIKGNTAKKYTLETGVISKPLLLNSANGKVRIGGTFGGSFSGVAPEGTTTTVKGKTGFVAPGN
jgi:hypothetical protein